jgi:hypothetical protein
MGNRLHLRLQVQLGYRLGDPVGHGRDGAFKLPLLQSAVGMAGAGSLGAGPELAGLVR